MIPWIFIDLYNDMPGALFEPFYRITKQLFANYKQTFDAWEDGGIKGIVIGRMRLGETGKMSLAWQPDPETYRARGIEPPPKQDIDPEKEKTLHSLLDDAAGRGWKVQIFVSHPPTGPLPFEEDPWGAIRSVTGVQDMMNAFPQASGHIIDGPGEGHYELAFIHGGEVFETTEDQRKRWALFGKDVAKIERGVRHIRERFHNLTRSLVRYHAPGGVLDGMKLFDINDDVLYWLNVRKEMAVGSMKATREEMDKLNRKIHLGGIPRAVLFSALTAQDYRALTKYFDYTFPKHYFWHRGFDGMYGTLYRWVQRIGTWNPELTEADCFAVVKAWFGIKLPGIERLHDFDRVGFPDEFFSEIVCGETRRALAAADGDTDKIIPWISTGQAPHCGDPMPSHDLYRILKATKDAGATRFLFHSINDLGGPEWSIISEMCGNAWDNDPRGYWPTPTEHPSSWNGGREVPDEP